MIGRVALVAALALAAACDPRPLGDGSRKAVLRTLDDELLVPAYAELAGLTEALAAAARAHPSIDAAALAELQERWRAARVAWVRTQAHRLGPVTDDLYEARIAQWPIDPAQVEALVAGDAPIDRAAIDALGGNKKGLGVAEYLLFGAPDGVASLAGPRRRAYLAAVLDAIAGESAALAAAWRDGYGDRFIDIGAADAPFEDIKEAVDAVVNASVFVAEYAADTRLGKPLGAHTGTPDPSLLESPWSDHGGADLVATYDGLALVLDPPDADGAPRLASIIAAARPAVAARVRRELAEARALAAAMPRPLAAAVAARDPAALAAWAAARALEMTYHSEVIAALGATLSLDDNDGD